MRAVKNLIPEGFEEFAEASLMMIHSVDPLGNVHYSNRAGLNFINASSAALSGFNWLQALHPMDKDALLKQLADAQQSRQTFKSHYRIFLPDNTLRWVESSITPRFSGNGEYLGFITTSTDVTHYQQLEAVMLEERQKYQEVLENIYDGIWTWDLATNEVFWNDRLYEMHGVSRETFTPNYDSFKSLVHPDDLENVLKALSDHLDHGIPYEIILRQRHISGDYGWFFARGTAIRDENGKPIRMAGATIDITDRKNAERALAASESRYSRIIQASEDGFWDWDILAQTDVYWSDSMYSLFGLSRNSFEASPERFFDLLHPDDRSIVMNRLEEHLQDPAIPFNVEYRIMHSDGHYRYMHGRGEAYRNEDGAPIQMSGIVTDITERKKAEATMRESEARFRSMADLAPIMSIMLDHQGNLIYLNQAWKEFTGISLADPHCPLDWEMLIHPKDYPQTSEVVYRAFQTHESFLAEYRQRHRDGTYSWVNAIFSPRMMDGSFIGFTGSIYEIENLKLAKEAAERSKEATQVLYHWEKKANEVTRQFQKSQQKQECYNIVVEAVSKALNVDRCFIIEVVNNNEALPIEFLSQSPDIKSFQGIVPDFNVCPCLVSCSQHEPAFALDLQAQLTLPDVFQEFLREYSIRGAAALPIHYNDELLCVLVLHTREPKSWTDHEILFLKTVAERLCISVYQNTVKEHLEKASQMKTQFISNLSHELRTPLNAVLGYAEMLEKGIAGELDERQLKYTRNVVASGKHLLDMVNEILDLAKIESGKTVLYPEWLNLETLMKDKYATFEALARKKNVHLAFDIAPGLDRVYVDPLRINQILLNLIGNAIKFNRDKDGEVNIHWHRSEDGEWVICEIQDTGIGIPQEKIAELFTDFYQVDNSFARKHEGTGLGLSVTKRLIELHGGSISLESKLGEGTTFSFQLPHPPEGNGASRQAK